MKTIILIIIYLISCILCYLYMKIAHGKKGRWSNLNIGIIDVFFSFSPIINSFVAMLWIFANPYRDFYNKNNFNKFFNVKK